MPRFPTDARRPFPIPRGLSPNSDATACHSNDDWSNQSRRVTRQKLAHTANLIVNSQLNQPDDRTVRQLADENQFAEVLVLRYQHTFIL